MQALLTIRDSGTRGSNDFDGLKSDIDGHVGPATYATVEASAGSKGMFGLDVGTLLVSLTGAPAIATLVGVLKSYFESNRLTEIEITGTKGSAKLKLPAHGALNEDQIRQVLDRVLGVDPNS